MGRGFHGVVGLGASCSLSLHYPRGSNHCCSNNLPVQDVQQIAWPNGAVVVVSTDNKISGLRDRILDLETNLLLNKSLKLKALTCEANI